MSSILQTDPCSLSRTLLLVRRIRGMKQAHAAELLGVTQPTVSRIERGELEPTGSLRHRLLDLVSARFDPLQDAALRRLIDHSTIAVHLVCDVTHRLFAASHPREFEWRRSASELRGNSLWCYATESIQQAEARLSAIGWGEWDGPTAFEFVTNANDSDELRIFQGSLLWEHVTLSDGSPARLVSTLPVQFVP